MGTLPFFAVLFIPILLGHSALFPWTAPGDQTSFRATAPYLNVPFFLVRAAVYFGVWSALGLVVMDAAWKRRFRGVRRDLVANAKRGMR